MRKIRLCGALGKMFGEVHFFEISTPAEAVRALIANFPGFEKELMESERKNVGYKVINGKYALDGIKEITDPAAQEIKIVPVVMGASGGTRIIIGSALIVAAVAMSYFSGGSLNPIAWKVGLIGGTLVLGGVAQLLTKTPGLEIYENNRDNKPSYIFNGPVNTTSQGHCVPVGYGTLLVGGAVVSAGITTEQIMAGYRYVQKTYTQDLTYNYDSAPAPPANWFRKELISRGNYQRDAGDGCMIWEVYEVYRFYYYVTEKEAVPV